MAAVLHFVKGEAEFKPGSEKKLQSGSLVHMTPGLSHGIAAKTPVVMLLFMLKQVRVVVQFELAARAGRVAFGSLASRTPTISSTLQM